MSTHIDAAQFVARLEAHRSPEQAVGYRRSFQAGAGGYGEGDQFIGVRMGQVFTLAQEFIALPPGEIERLLDSPIHEVRAGALSIMDKQGRRNTTPADRRHDLYGLYLRRHDRINNWDLVDLGAPFVVGRYLADKPRDPLYTLARSANLWERRTAIVATAYFIRQGDLDDTFRIAEILLDDDHDLIHKAAGGWLREAGTRDRPGLLAFLDCHAATMPRTFLRYTIEHLNPEQRGHYLGLKGAGRRAAGEGPTAGDAEGRSTTPHRRCHTTGGISNGRPHARCGAVIRSAAGPPVVSSLLVDPRGIGRAGDAPPRPDRPDRIGPCESRAPADELPMGGLEVGGD